MAAGKVYAAFAEDGVETVRKACDALVNTAELCCFFDFIVRVDVLKEEMFSLMLAENRKVS